MYAIVDAVNGVPIVGNVKVFSAVSIDESKCVAWLGTDVSNPEWEVITEEIYNELIPKSEV